MAEADWVKQVAEELGFEACGIAPAEPSDYGRELRDWLAQGKHGEMGYLAERVETRVDPRNLLPGARSVICVADQLPTDDQPGRTGSREGRVARYAQVNDYHKIIKKRLFRLADTLRSRWPEAHVKVCVDTAPILEREHAKRAGIGWVGKNTLTLNRYRGSHLLLGELLTTVALDADEPETDHCGSCTRCIDACPTDCITPYSVDASRCISYLTIEHRSEISVGFHKPMGDWLFGCDVCQEVCPFNRYERAGSVADRYERRAGAMDLLEVLGWSEADRRAAFVKSPMKRAKLPQMKRNAVIVAGNKLREEDDPVLRERIEEIAEDHEEADTVRETARQVLDRLRQLS